MIHDLKIWPEHYELVHRGYKTFELRKNDRNYQVDDTLHLHEWDPTNETYTGRECTRVVTHMLDGMWMDDGYCILSIVDEQQVKRHAVLEWLWRATKVKMAAHTPEEVDVAQRDCDAAMVELEASQNKEGDRGMGEHFKDILINDRFNEWNKRSKEGAQNMMIVGTSGGGMSYALKQSIGEGLEVIIDPKDEYVPDRQTKYAE